MTGNDLLVTHLSDITKSHLSEYLASLSDYGLSGRTWARKLAAIKEYFRFLVGSGAVATSPAETMSAPKRERGAPTSRLRSTRGCSPWLDPTHETTPSCRYFSRPASESANSAALPSRMWILPTTPSPSVRAKAWLIEALNWRRRGIRRSRTTSEAGHRV